MCPPTSSHRLAESPAAHMTVTAHGPPAAGTRCQRHRSLPGDGRAPRTPRASFSSCPDSALSSPPTLPGVASSAAAAAAAAAAAWISPHRILRRSGRRLCSPQRRREIPPRQRGQQSTGRATRPDDGNSNASTGVHPADHPFPAPTTSHCCEGLSCGCSPRLRPWSHRRTLTRPSTASRSRTGNNTDTGSTGT